MCESLKKYFLRCCSTRQLERGEQESDRAGWREVFLVGVGASDVAGGDRVLNLGAVGHERHLERGNSR